MRIARLARFCNMPGFRKSGHNFTMYSPCYLLPEAFEALSNFKLLQLPGVEIHPQ